MSKKLYNTNIKCKNCGEFMIVEVPIGRLVKNYLSKKSISCINCECRLV